MRVAKTLIIGVGTSGQNICEKVANNLSYKYGDYKNASWVGIKVLETAHKSEVLEKSDFIGMSVEPSAFADYVSGAQHVGRDFGWNEWGDPNLLKNLGYCINDGAGNIRMAGRLALFHNYPLISSSIISEIHRLQNLSPAEIQKVLDTQDNIDIMTGGIQVFVIGSLCGGTGSGCCCDLGYLLRVWENDDIAVTGIFTLPHWSLQCTRLKKNAFVALTELNHYMLKDSEWFQKLPGFSNPVSDKRKPYDIVYLTQPATAETEQIRSNESTIASFLTAICTETSHDIAAANVDGINILATNRQLGYLSPTFSSFGIASLEYTSKDILKIEENISADIASIQENSRPSIEVCKYPIPVRFQNDPDMGNINVCKFSYAFCSNEESSLFRKELIQGVINELSNALELRRPVFDIRETNKDTYKIMCLQMEYGFSLAHIKGMMKIDDSDDQALENSLSCNDFAYWNTRKDVKWKDCFVSKDVIDKIKQYWLVYRLLGGYRENGSYLICDKKGKPYVWYKTNHGKICLDVVEDNFVQTEKIELSLENAIIDIASNPSIQRVIEMTCQNRIKACLCQVGKKQFIKILFKCLENLGKYTLNITRSEAEDIIIEYCFANVFESNKL